MKKDFMKRMMKATSNKYVSNYIDSEILQINNFIDTGNYLLNGLFANDLFKGMPEGRIVELSGDSGTGKSLIMTSVLKNFILSSKNNVVVFFDSEFGTNVQEMKSSISDEIFQAQFIHHEINTYEELIQFSAQQLEEMEKIKVEDPSINFLVCLDSLGGLMPQSQIDKAVKGDETKVMREQQLIKLFFNNIRRPLARSKASFLYANHTYLDIMNSNKYTPKTDKSITRGGQGVMYTPDIKIRLFKLNLKNEEKTQIGIRVQAVATKSRYVALNAEIEFHVLFKKGVDRYSGLWDFAIDNNVITKSGAGVGTTYSIEELNWHKKTGELKKINNLSEIFTKEVLDICNRKFQEKYTLESINENITEEV